MSDDAPREGSLVLYKLRPARVKRAGEKLDIEIEGGEIQKVRPKDVALLHPGPIASLNDLRPLRGEVDTAWEMLAGTTTTLPELAELAFGAYTPVSAWAAWQLVADGLCFRGSPQDVAVATPEEVAGRRAARAAEAAEKRAWSAFAGRVHEGRFEEGDATYLKDVEGLALGQSTRSRVLHELGRQETAESAHALLLALGHWSPTFNPYPRRLKLPTTPSRLALPDLPDEPRRDLTHLLAFAIDDASTETPDDALSLDGSRLWVHVADGAAVVVPGSPLDLEARARGATLHLPEGAVPMLPPEATPMLGLGLGPVSPALSFGLDIADGQVAGCEIIPSWVRVTRLTYEEVDAKLAEEPFRALFAIAQGYEAVRLANGAVDIDLPEVDVKVIGDEIDFLPVLPLDSRKLVENAMVMTGEAVARYGLARGIPLPFATQEASEAHERPRTWSEMFALRRTLKRGQYRSVPAPHAALGLDAYTQATSPLRRYLDLVVHQQLRAYLRGERLLSAEEILERVGAVEAVIGDVRQAERLSERHWTLLYLQRHVGWRGEGSLVEKRGLGGTLIIPELGLETQVHLAADPPLDSKVRLVLSRVDLPLLDARFRAEG